jgi:hypothetical protein
MANKSQSDVARMLDERNLAARVFEELIFLGEVDALGDILYHPSVIRLAVARYELLWLPLFKDAKSDDQLLPPVDIAFAWHTHCLSPVRCGARVLPNANSVQVIVQSMSNYAARFKPGQLFRLELMPSDSFFDVANIEPIL